MGPRRASRFDRVLIATSPPSRHGWTASSNPLANTSPASPRAIRGPRLAKGPPARWAHRQQTERPLEPNRNHHCTPPPRLRAEMASHRPTGRCAPVMRNPSSGAGSGSAPGRRGVSATAARAGLHFAVQAGLRRTNSSCHLVLRLAGRAKTTFGWLRFWLQFPHTRASRCIRGPQRTSGMLAAEPARTAQICSLMRCADCRSGTVSYSSRCSGVYAACFGMS
jgi:hypothetical protein